MADRHKYHVVYHFKTNVGFATGRCFYSSDNALDTADNIEQAESFVLENARKKEPTASNLFFTFWSPLRADSAVT